MTDTSSFTLFVGVDIASTSFVAAWTTPPGLHEPPTSFAQNEDGFAALLSRLAERGAIPSTTLVVMEATSSYWIPLAVTLHEAGYHVSVLNPAQTHNYVKSLPRRSKTDALDAQALLQFALERTPRRWSPPPAIYHELRQRLVARDALAEMRQQARNQRHSFQHWPVVISSVGEQFETLIAEFDARITALDAEIALLLHDGAWAESATLLQSIPGIGPATTAWLLVTTLNFEHCPTPEALVAFAGLAPLLHESGISVRGRSWIGRGGHARLRKAMYLATISAARHNPSIREFHDRLRAAGKAPKVARCAAARKLLHIAWAVVTKRQTFTPSIGMKQTSKST